MRTMSVNDESEVCVAMLHR